MGLSNGAKIKVRLAYPLDDAIERTTDSVIIFVSSFLVFSVAVLLIEKKFECAKMSTTLHY